MKPVLQTNKGIGGNCLSASLASIFESTLEEFDDLNLPDGLEWFGMLNQYLSESRGIMLLLTTLDFARELNADTYHLVYGRVSGKDYYHAQVGYKGAVVHDPMGHLCELEESNAGIFIKLYP